MAFIQTGTNWYGGKSHFILGLRGASFARAHQYSQNVGMQRSTNTLGLKLSRKKTRFVISFVSLILALAAGAFAPRHQVVTLTALGRSDSLGATKVTNNEDCDRSPPAQYKISDKIQPPTPRQQQNLKNIVR